MLAEDTIKIEVNKEDVWTATITIDVESWPQWAPHFQEIKRGEVGDFQLGSSAWIKQKGMAKTKWVVTAFDNQNSFTWETAIPGMRMRATHELRGDERVENTLRLEASGIISFVFGPILKKQIKKSLKLENQNLKKFCEKKIGKKKRATYSPL